jgi:hypothetical protein
MATSTQFGMDAWGAVTAPGYLVGLADVLGELLVEALACRGDSGAVGVGLSALGWCTPVEFEKLHATDVA